MQTLERAIKKRVLELIEKRVANRVMGWRKGLFCYDNSPAVLTGAQIETQFVYNEFCGSNLSKYLIDESKKEGKIIALLKPCDTYSFNQLVKEYRINRDNVYVLGVACHGMVDIEKLRLRNVHGIRSVEEAQDGLLKITAASGDTSVKKKDLFLAKCRACWSKQHAVFDEIVDGGQPMRENSYDRFGTVRKLESMTPGERFAFWQAELSECIRCNACRNVCPACSCLKCVFDNNESGIAGKVNEDPFDGNIFHIVRAFHVAGRCTDCGECTRVCPRGIPLHLLNRKFIKDINEMYGEYNAGEDDQSPWPLVRYDQDDMEPGTQLKGGEGYEKNPDEPHQ